MARSWRDCARAPGSGVPLIVTHDLHANLSERLVEACDMLIGYTTNPHVDMRDRGEEAAFAMRRMLGGMRPKSAFIRLPLTPPSVTLLTAAGPYADMIDHGQRLMRESGGEIINVTILGGFVFSDTPKNGVAIVVTARSDEAAARALARGIAEYGWSIRERFRRELMSIEDAASLALETAADPARPAVIFSDAGDNPGGGGEGRTTWLLRALVGRRRAPCLLRFLLRPRARGRGAPGRRGGADRGRVPTATGRPSSRRSCG